MKRIISLIASLMLIAIFTVFMAGAVPTGWTPTNVTNATFSNTSGSMEARGGNITNVDFTNVLSQTSKWQGYYGNVTGEIMLGTTSTAKMYNWTVSTIAGEVFATQASTMNYTAWEDLGPRTGAQIDTDFNFLAADSDSGTNTFTRASPVINASGNMIPATANSAARTYNATGNITWWTIAMARSSAAESNYVFAGVISNDGEAYDGTTKDFQMIVPENQETGVDTYYFYVELT
ncbi:MAG TPA: hypothetical protein VIO58_00610 [Candidatus Methanoperedens sp.]